MSIAIIGAGVAGLSAAISLCKSGVEVHLFERAPALTDVGSGIMLQPSGMAALKAMGALDHCLRLGSPSNGVYGSSPLNRKLILDTRYEHWKPGAHGLGIHRSVLLDALLTVARQEGVVFHFGTEVSDYEPGDTLKLKIDGQWTEDLYDALIIASGRNSSLQYKASVKCHKRPYEWGALWATVEMPERMALSHLRQWYRGSHEMLGALPIGRTHADGKEACSLFWSQRIDTFTALLKEEGGLETWKDQVRLLAGDQLNVLLDKITSPDQLVLSTYSDIHMDHWHHDNVLAIGDCAHSMSPQLGQGANMALVDGLVLGEEALLGIGFNDICDCHWPSVFKSYSSRRHDHLRFYQGASRFLTPMFQSNSRVYPLLRDFMLWTAQWLPFARQHAVSTLVGGRTGWLCQGNVPIDLHYWDGRKPS